MRIPTSRLLLPILITFSFSLHGQDCLTIISPGTTQVLSVGDTAIFQIEAAVADTNYNVSSVHVELKKSSEVVDEVLLLLDSSSFVFAFELPCIPSSALGNYYFLLTPFCDTDCNCDDGTISSGISNVTVLNAPEFAIQADPPGSNAIDCVNSSFDLSIQYQGAPINWNTGVTSNTITVDDGGTFSAFIDVPSGCTIEEKFEVADLRVTITPEFDQTGFPIVDCVDEFTIDMTPMTQPMTNGPFLFEWEGPGLIADDAAEDILVTDMMPGNYSVTITDLSSNCVGEGAFEVAVDSEMPTAHIESPAPAITCIDAVISLDGSMSYGSSSGMDYLWSTPNGNLLSGNSLSTVLINEGGIYTLTVTNHVGLGCTHDTTIIIGENMLEPEIEIEGSEVLCSGSSNELLANNLSTDMDVTYDWNSGMGTSDILEITSEGTYSVIVTSMTNGCTSESSIEVTESPAPVLDLNTLYFDIQSGEFLSLPIPVDAIWELVGNTNIESVVIENVNDFAINIKLENEGLEGLAVLEVYLENEEGCQSNIELITITVQPNITEIFVPELISPNADGWNDTWDVIFPNSDDAANFQVKIFNRSGSLIHESPDMLIPWDAKNCPDGTYYYVIEGNNVIKKGAITVLRN